MGIDCYLRTPDGKVPASLPEELPVGYRCNFDDGKLHVSNPLPGDLWYFRGNLYRSIFEHIGYNLSTPREHPHLAPLYGTATLKIIANEFDMILKSKPDLIWDDNEPIWEIGRNFLGREGLEAFRDLFVAYADAGGWLVSWD